MAKTGNCFYCGSHGEIYDEDNADHVNDPRAFLHHMTPTPRMACGTYTCQEEFKHEALAKGWRKWSICDDCDGEGNRVHPDLSVWTESQRAEDPDGFVSMMRGEYDVPCETCKGSGKVNEWATHEERRGNKEWWVDDPISKAERAMGC